MPKTIQTSIADDIFPQVYLMTKGMQCPRCYEYFTIEAHNLEKHMVPYVTCPGCEMRMHIDGVTHSTRVTFTVTVDFEKINTDGLLERIDCLREVMSNPEGYKVRAVNVRGEVHDVSG